MPIKILRICDVCGKETDITETIRDELKGHPSALGSIAHRHLMGIAKNEKVECSDCLLTRLRKAEYSTNCGPIRLWIRICRFFGLSK